MPEYKVYCDVTVRLFMRNVRANTPKEAAEVVWTGMSFVSLLDRSLALPAGYNGHDAWCERIRWQSGDEVEFEVHDPSTVQPNEVYCTDEEGNLFPADELHHLALVVRNDSIVEARSMNPTVRKVVVLNEDLLPELVPAIRENRVNIDRLDNQLQVRRSSVTAARKAYEALILKQLGDRGNAYEAPRGTVNTMPVEIIGVDEWWPDMDAILPRGPKQATEADRAARDKADALWVTAAEPMEAWRKTLIDRLHEQLGGGGGTVSFGQATTGTGGGILAM